jgi:hypothetical protein
MPWRRIGEWKYRYTFLNHGTRRGWVVSFTLLPLYPREYIPRYPFYSRLDGPQNRSGRYREEKIMSLAGIESRAFQPVARRNTDWAIPFRNTTNADWNFNGFCQSGRTNAGILRSNLSRTFPAASFLVQWLSYHAISYSHSYWRRPYKKHKYIRESGYTWDFLVTNLRYV